MAKSKKLELKPIKLKMEDDAAPTGTKYAIKEASIKDDFCNYTFEITEGVGQGASHKVVGPGIVKEELIDAFRQHGIYPRNLKTLSEESLAWNDAEPGLQDYEKIATLGEKLHSFYSNMNRPSDRKIRWKAMRSQRSRLHKLLQEKFWDVIGDLVRLGTTVLLTTQYLEEADRLADDIVVVDHGQVIARGDARSLKRRNKPKTKPSRRPPRNCGFDGSGTIARAFKASTRS